MEPTDEEAYLLRGVRADLDACSPVRTDVPAGSIAAIECTSSDPAVARVGLYLFPDNAAMLDAYFARMDAEGVPRNTIACDDPTGAGEGSYMGGEGDVPYRSGCFVNSDGYANFRATLPGSVYLGILGRSRLMRPLDDFAWKGNEDTPGSPTVWRQPVE